MYRCVWELSPYITIHSMDICIYTYYKSRASVLSSGSGHYFGFCFIHVRFTKRSASQGWLHPSRIYTQSQKLGAAVNDMPRLLSSQRPEKNRKCVRLLWLRSMHWIYGGIMFIANNIASDFVRTGRLFVGYHCFTCFR